MARAKREFTKGQIDRAGKALVDLPWYFPDRDDAVAIVDNWRSCHAYPLTAITQTLRNRARRIDQSALIAQRLKRRPSIEIKLRENPNMKLSQMQDLGGCRAVLKDMRLVRQLIRSYEEADAKAGPFRTSLLERDDYIECPKIDGYRGYHFITKYDTSSLELACYKNQRIEIQIRSQLQHSWATAVETAQLFTGQALKSKIKTASKDWLRFFALTSGAFALRERSTNVPDTPTDRSSLIAELRIVEYRLNALLTLQGWKTSIQVMADDYPITRGQYVLRLDMHNRRLRVFPFEESDFESAQELYQKYEREAETNQKLQVVMVSVDDIRTLQRAYPNYYLDTGNFIEQVRREINSK